MIKERQVCDCGRVHEAHSTKLVVDAGAGEALPKLVRELTDQVPLIFYDGITHKLLGEKIDALCGAADLKTESVVCGEPDELYEPNAEALEKVLEALRRPGVGLLVGVGSGSINDTAKYAAHKAGVPYICYATAPSMDGYMSPTSALLIDGVKITFDAKAPECIIGDLDVLAAAPQHLVAAGFADLIGKLTSLRDWELASVLFDEYWCGTISDHVEKTASTVLNSVEALNDRSHESVRTLLNGLIEAGIAAYHVGNTRPTSGSEHLVSHYIEMRTVNEGRPGPFHGHAVGVGMLVISELVQAMLELTPEAIERTTFAPADLDQVLAELRIPKVPDNFGKAKFDHADRNARIPEIVAKWDAIQAVLRKVPTPETILTALKKIEAPTTFTELGVGDMALDAVKHARYVRARYTMLDLAADLGVLDREAERIVATYR